MAPFTPSNAPSVLPAKAPMLIGARAARTSRCGDPAAGCSNHSRAFTGRRPLFSCTAQMQEARPRTASCSSSPQQPFAGSHGRCSGGRRRRHVVRAHQDHAGDDAAVENLIIIGSGPAGYTAAIYAARANLAPVVFEGYQAGGVRGGQLMTTSEVENFPGFPEGITGPDLMERMAAQAERWGSELLPEDVESVDLQQRPFVVRGTETVRRAHSIIVATGATAKRLGLPSEDQFWSNGISACAICDGASPGFKNQELAVVGGGDTALEEALYLTKYGKHVHLLVRSERMRASKTMQDRVLNNSKITVHMNASIRDAYGNGKGQLAGVHVVENSGEEKKLPVKGLFYGIGHQPNSGFLNGQLQLDDHGYVQVTDGAVGTNVEGVYVAGDLFDTEWRQAITAAGSGCMAALSAERYLAGNDLLQERHAQKKEEEKEKAAEKPKEEQQAAQAAEDVDLDQTRHQGQIALRRLYHESQRPLVVMYTSPGCGPCRSLKPIVGKLADEYADKIHLVEINIEQDSEIAEAAGVTGTPTIQMFHQKQRVEHLPGVKMKSDYRNKLEKLLTS